MNHMNKMEHKKLAYFCGIYLLKFSGLLYHNINDDRVKVSTGWFAYGLSLRVLAVASLLSVKYYSFCFQNMPLLWTFAAFIIGFTLISCYVTSTILFIRSRRFAKLLRYISRDIAKTRSLDFFKTHGLLTAAMLTTMPLLIKSAAYNFRNVPFWLNLLFVPCHFLLLNGNLLGLMFFRISCLHLIKQLGNGYDKLKQEHQHQITLSFKKSPSHQKYLKNFELLVLEVINYVMHVTSHKEP